MLGGIQPVCSLGVQAGAQAQELLRVALLPLPVRPLESVPTLSTPRRAWQAPLGGGAGPPAPPPVVGCTH